MDGGTTATAILRAAVLPAGAGSDLLLPSAAAAPASGAGRSVGGPP
jgi:hypothetical protein